MKLKFKGVKLDKGYLVKPAFRPEEFFKTKREAIQTTKKKYERGIDWL